jgi:hypothetical protein
MRMMRGGKRRDKGNEGREKERGRGNGKAPKTSIFLLQLEETK